jgi:hypothetical protein
VNQDLAMRVTCSTHGIFAEVADPVLLDTAIAAHLAADHPDAPEPDIWVVMESDNSVNYPHEAGELPEKQPSVNAAAEELKP